MKLAAIDIGSNSIHMIVASIDGYGAIEVIDKHKEMARLGEETLATGYLSEAAQERGLQTLHRFKSIADSHQVRDIIAYATSATREARNGEDFIKRVEDECGIRARIIDGIEEGRLIYLGAREVYDFGIGKTLIMDLGGGSLEFILADQRREYIVKSLKLGVRRLKDRFLPSDPPTPDEIEELVEYIRPRAAYVIQSARKRGFDRLLGTSGTIGAIARMTAAVSEYPERHNPNDVPRDPLLAMVDRLLALDAEQREDFPELEEKRRDIILHGAILVRTVVEMCGTDGFTYCDAALREGMIVDYLEKNRPGLRLEEDIPDPRRRTVLLVAKRFYDSMAHAHNVARIALRLFDDLMMVHRLGHPEREWLEYAALLHNVGHAIRRSGHHRHSLYIIRHADLSGFSEREQLMMANIARYHRRSAPKSRHEAYMELAPADREVVKKLSVLLRLATALDRGRRGNVYRLSCVVRGTVLELRIMTHDDPALELQTTRGQARHIEKTYGLTLDVGVTEVVPTLV